MESSTSLPGAIWTRDSCDRAPFSHLSPSLLTTCQIWESNSISDFPNSCPAICSRLLVAPTASQGSKGNTVLTNNKELAIVSSVNLIKKKNITLCVDSENAQGSAAFTVIGWFLNISNIQPTSFQVQVGQTWREQSILLKFASVTALLIGVGK